jgi:hypothetical protein
VEIVDILRVLLRARLLVVAGALPAIVVGIFAGFQISLAPPKIESRREVTGVAVARLQVDTAPSAVTNARSQDIGVLGTQARLLADFMATDEVKARVARIAAIPVAKLVVIGPSMLEPIVPSPLAKRASEAAATAREPYVLTVGAGLGSELPIITIETAAPDRRSAGLLAVAGVKGLVDSVSSLGTPGARRLVVRQLGAPRAASKASASTLPVAIVLTLALLVMWCGVIVVAKGLAGRLRDDTARRALVLE